MSPRFIWNTHTTGLKYPKGGVIGKKISVEKKAKLDILNLESSAGGYAAECFFTDKAIRQVNETFRTWPGPPYPRRLFCQVKSP